MAKKMLIDATHAEETRVVVVDGNKVEEFDFESENKRQLAGNIYLAKVTRVEPSLQAAFVDYGGNRHGFLAFSEIHPDYYQIPVADREALMAEERAYAEALASRDEEDDKPRRRSRSRSRSRAAEAAQDDPKLTREAGEEVSDEISGMETIDLDAVEEGEGLSPMETVAETPVEEPDADEPTAGLEESGDEDGDDGKSQPSERDESIEAVADDDTQEEIRPPRKPRPRRYKIQEVIKVRQIMLVQVVKEERGNKGAALTTYLSLAGRYCVLMPNTARGGGISRKITNAADRKKLKDIATSIDVPDGAGLIIRTAGAKRTKTEIKRDYEYLQRLWEQIRELTLKSIAPAKIYEEGDLIKRSIRDLYNREIDEVLVEGERGYRIAKDFMKMIMPSHAKNVKHYVDQMPLFARHQVESYLSGMFNPTVQLKSGGYIVIGVTEALVAIDVNSGRATKEGSIEETALKTNLEAAEEVARQLRLRDLAGLIVIDFIDMDERKNNAAVEKKLKDKLKNDRARIQVGRISGFGLLEMSRQRLRPGMIEATTQPCPACHGTGLIRSDDNMALQVLRQIEEEGVRGRSREVLVKCPVSIANFLMNQKREHVAQIEARYGMSVRIEGDTHLVSPDFTLEKFRTASRSLPEMVAPVVSVDTSIMDAVDDMADEDASDSDVADQDASDAGEATNGQASEDDQKPKKRRRRSRRGGRGRGRNRDRQEENGDENRNGRSDTRDRQETGDRDAEEAGTPEGGDTAPADTDDTAPADSQQAEPQQAEPRQAEPAPDVTEAEALKGDTADVVPAEETPAEEKPKPRRTRRSPARKPAKAAEAEEVEIAEEEAPAPKKRKAPSRAKKTDEAEGADSSEAKPRKRTTRSRKKPAATEATATEAPETGSPAEAEQAQAPTPVQDRGAAAAVAEVPQETPAASQADAPAAASEAPAQAETPPESAKPTEAAPAAEEKPLETAGADAGAAEEKPKKKRRGWWAFGQ